MSCMRVFPIAADGTVQVGQAWEAKNAWGGGWLIWSTLGERTGTLGAVFDENRFAGVWKRFGSFAEYEDWVLGMTFDGCWVKRENLPTLIEAIGQFDRSLTPPEGGAAHTTLSEVVKALDHAFHVSPALLGVCFQVTSVARNLWERYEEDTETVLPDDDEGFPQVAEKHIVTNVLTHTETASNGARIWELGAEVASVRQAKRLHEEVERKAPRRGGKVKVPAKDEVPDSTPPDPEAVAVLVRKMLDETKGKKPPESIRETAYHKALVALGVLALPGILRVYDRESDALRLSVLLADVVGTTPVPRTVAKKAKESRAHWLAWAKQRRYV